MSVLHCDSSCTRYICMKISTCPTQFTVWYSIKTQKVAIAFTGGGGGGRGGVELWRAPLGAFCLV